MTVFRACLILLVVATGTAHAQVATHYVTPAGSASSNCTSGDPCTITRAVALIAAGTINDGHTVEMAAGGYGQNTLIITGSGSNGAPITIRGAAQNGTSYLFPGRLQTVHTSWTLTAGRTYTYEYVFDEVALGWTPAGVSQDRPTNWQNIVVKDSNDVRFEMTVPPKYKVQTTVAEVEAQHCSSFFDSVANRMYVHLCDDLAPAAAHNLWITSTSWGSVRVQGDYITIDGLGIDHASNSSYGMRVEATADNFIGRSIAFNGSQFNGQGTNGLLYAAHFQSTGQQGPPTSPNCDWDNSTPFVGACWNNSGSATALVLDDLGPRTVSHSLIEKGWNGLSCGGTGAVTITQSTFRSFPNHPFGCEGNGRTITYNTITNNQEGLFSNVSTSNMDNITFEHNLVFNTALMWGLGTNTNWTVRYNIFDRIRVDNTTEATGTFDCNLYFQIAEDGVIFDRGGAGDANQAEYTTVAQIQAGIAGFETNSIHLAAGSATDGTQFTQFTTYTTDVYDITPVEGAQALNMPAACGDFVGPIGMPSEPAPDLNHLSRVLIQCPVDLAAPVHTAGTINACTMPEMGGFRMFGHVTLVDEDDLPIVFPTDASHGLSAVNNGQQAMAECDNITTGVATEGGTARVLADCRTRGLRIQAVGNTSFRYISAGGGAEDKTAVATAAGILLGISARNTHATTDAHIKCTNLASGSTTPGSSTVFYELFVPAVDEGGTAVDREINLTFGTALTCYIVSGDADSDATDVASGDVSYNLTYTLR
jgi:hypothetical protein